MLDRWMVAALVVSVFGCSSSSTPSDTGGGALTACTPVGGGAHFVIDPKDGKCKLDGTTTNVGAPCSGATAAVCGTEQNASCLAPPVDEFPGGYCNVDPCTAAEGHLCPIGSSCVQLYGENGQCFKDCATDADCRQSDGYFCLDMTADDHPGGLWQSGASHKVCSRHDVTCPVGAQDCPAAFPRCVLPSGGPAYDDAGTFIWTAPDAGPDAAPVAPPTPMCVQ
jgi:hypothetical protein